MLKVGVKLVGLYIIASSVANLLSEVVDVVWWSRVVGFYVERGIPHSGSSTFGRYASIVVTLLKVGLGSTYAIRSGWVVQMIERRDHA